jgi:ubiquinone/menaquinone biosynthesis C-methylase UbiE
MSQSVSFDRVANQYDATRGYPPGVPARIAAGFIAAGGLSRGADALELGIGTGRIALPLLAQGINVTGVDISARMVEHLTANYEAQRGERPEASWGKLAAEMANMTALPFPDNRFDAVIGVHILHLVPDWRRALDEAFRVLRPGASLLLGQDRRENPELDAISDYWQDVVRELGHTPRRVGAKGYGEIVAELRARGLPVREQVAVAWPGSETPRAALENITLRLWSLTWHVPDDIFAESARRLEVWVNEHYGDTLDLPRPGAYSFTIATVTKPNPGEVANSN